MRHICLRKDMDTGAHKNSLALFCRVCGKLHYDRSDAAPKSYHQQYTDWCKQHVTAFGCKTATNGYRCRNWCADTDTCPAGLAARDESEETR